MPKELPPIGSRFGYRQVQIAKRRRGSVALDGHQLHIDALWERSPRVVDLNQPLSLEAFWYRTPPTRSWFGLQPFNRGFHAEIRQHDHQFILYADQGTAEVGARLGIPNGAPEIRSDTNRVRLHPQDLAEILEILTQNQALSS